MSFLQRTVLFWLIFFMTVGMVFTDQNLATMMKEDAKMDCTPYAKQIAEEVKKAGKWIETAMGQLEIQAEEKTEPDLSVFETRNF